MIRNGWEIFYHPLFATQYQRLESEVFKLETKLSESAYRTHEVVKLFAAITIGIEEKIPIDPFASHFTLTGVLRKYCRLKKMGLNERYRLFFKPFKQEKKIVILWLGYPRKEGDKKDCYVLFAKMVSRGKFPETLNFLIAECGNDLI